MTTDTSAHPEPEEPLAPAKLVFLASLVGLFLELALIRWVSSEVRVFAYCKNLALVASFLGFGTGCLLSRRPIRPTGPLFGMLLLTLVVRLPWRMLDSYGPRRVSEVMAALSGFMMFRGWQPVLPEWGDFGRLAFAAGWTALLFFAIAYAMVPFGQWTASGMARVAGPLRAYSINVAGSLAGILLYTAASATWLPPVCWFVPAAVCCATFTAERRLVREILAISVGLVLVLLPDDGPDRQDVWSSYQKLTLVGHRQVVVNNVGYQTMDAQQIVGVDRISLPFVVRRPPGDVLVVGAGTGNDVAAALNAGARSVVAVEIDPAIYRMGHRWHPLAPYADPRVQVVIDDARHYLKTTRRQFDVIVFSHLDSHTVLSSFTSVRLDNYIYTVEAFREARARLSPGGIVSVSYFSQLPFISERLAKNLELAFGHPPVSLVEARDPGEPSNWQSVQFLTGSPEVTRSLEWTKTAWPLFQGADYSQGTPTLPSTDSWPFLPLQGRQIPPLILLISGVVLALSFLFAWKASPEGEAFDARVFWLGAAFMLVEVHNVSRLALVFGTTWQVNAWVIGAVLAVILAANAACAWLQRRGTAPGRGTASALFVSLCVAFALPVGSFLDAGPAGALAVTLLMTLPIFFAGLVFADAFSRTRSPSFALGWNVLGAVVGGMAESLSYVIGIPGLLLIAACFYAMALLARAGQCGAVLAASPGRVHRDEA